MFVASLLQHVFAWLHVLHELFVDNFELVQVVVLVQVDQVNLLVPFELVRVHVAGRQRELKLVQVAHTWSIIFALDKLGLGAELTRANVVRGRNAKFVLTSVLFDQLVACQVFASYGHLVIGLLLFIIALERVNAAPIQLVHVVVKRGHFARLRWQRLIGGEELVQVQALFVLELEYLYGEVANGRVVVRVGRPAQRQLVRFDRRLAYGRFGRRIRSTSPICCVNQLTGRFAPADCVVRAYLHQVVLHFGEIVDGELIHGVVHIRLVQFHVDIRPLLLLLKRQRGPRVGHVPFQYVSDAIGLECAVRIAWRFPLQRETRHVHIGESQVERLAWQRLYRAQTVRLTELATASARTPGHVDSIVRVAEQIGQRVLATLLRRQLDKYLFRFETIHVVQVVVLVLLRVRAEIDGFWHGHVVGHVDCSIAQSITNQFAVQPSIVEQRRPRDEH